MFVVVTTSTSPSQRPRESPSCVALSFNLAFTFFSGLAPVVAALLARNTGVAATAAYYMIGCAALSFVAALVMHRYDGRIVADLAAEPN